MVLMVRVGWRYGGYGYGGYEGMEVGFQLWGRDGIC